jgi:hypothetical protein
VDMSHASSKIEHMKAGYSHFWIYLFDPNTKKKVFCEDLGFSLTQDSEHEHNELEDVVKDIRDVLDRHFQML